MDSLKFYGLTAKIEIPNIYSVEQIDQFHNDVTEQESIKYCQNCADAHNRFVEIINRFSETQNMATIPGFSHYEKQYPEGNLFEDLEKESNASDYKQEDSESGENLVEAGY